MFKRTPGKWTWCLSPTKGQTGIYVEAEGDEKTPLAPTMGDLQLTAYAPAMNELLWHTLDNLNHIAFLVPSEKIVGITEINDNIGKLLAAINVAGPKVPAEIVREVKQFLIKSEA